MIAIVSYGSGNVRAIANIFRREHIPFCIADTASSLKEADRFLLPGVGAFDRCMSQLNASGMRDALDRLVVIEGRPVLGICVGMQMLADESEEGSERGLGWVPGAVRRFEPHHESATALQLPHMGWNTVTPIHPNPLFEGVDLALGYYFLHSYCFAPVEADDALATTTYGGEFTSVVGRGPILGVQFHPEKSHQSGIQLLGNFARLGGI